MSLPDGPEIALPAGDVTVGVVRIGDTVRRPHQPTSARVAEYLLHLERVGFDRCPRWLGRDARGRDVLSYVEGDVPGDRMAAWGAADALLPSVAALTRALHDASEGFQFATPEPPAPLHPAGAPRPVPRLPPGEPVLVAHRDVTPGNTVFRDGRAWALIDFDLCGSTTRATDLANTAMHWVPLCDPTDRPPALRGADVARRLRQMLDAYGRDRVSATALLDAAALRFASGAAVMQWRAEAHGGGWARMWQEGVGETIRRRVAWFARVRDDLAAALGE